MEFFSTDSNIQFTGSNVFRNQYRSNADIGAEVWAGNSPVAIRALRSGDIRVVSRRKEHRSGIGWAEFVEGVEFIFSD